MFPTEAEWYAALETRHGAERQRKFRAASVAICGLGGLGSNVALHLVRAGIGALYLYDFDRVDLANLNRQQYFPEQIGLYKAEALQQNLQRISPFTQITARTVKLTPENIPELLSSAPIICEAFDRADQKAMLVNTVLSCFPEKYIVAASGMAGLHPANVIRTRRVTKHFYLCGDETSDVDAETGIFSAQVAVCAAHQAETILRLIAGETET